MEWTAPETITVGAVFFAIVMLLNRFLGQRADPKLFEVLKQAMEGFSEVKDTVKEYSEKTNKAFSLLADNINKGNEASMALVGRVELSERNAMRLYDQVIASFVAFQESVKVEHKTALEETQSIVPALKPAITALTAQQAATEKSNKGMQAIMGEISKSQSATNGEILAALKRIEASLAEFKKDNAEKIEKIEADVNAVKADIAKRPAPIVAPPVIPLTEETQTPIQEKPNESA
jgi:hypothetical protein